jgi:hypothetical protein
MPSFADAASDAEMWDLANYVVALARKPIWSMTAEEIQQFDARQLAQAKADPARRGAQLVETLGCALFNRGDILVRQEFASGEFRWPF